ncbi:hypothetical protein WDL1P1_00354 (plasmid) [Variovorax sp. WDL1]|nr:hypothetical protein WDL1P1_00354 [Variovorax sp. WDL1]
MVVEHVPKTPGPGAAGRPLVALVVMALVGGLWYLGDAYTENGFKNCRANGSSYTWCQATIKWQSFKALF